MSDDPLSRAHQEIERLLHENEQFRKERNAARREVCHRAGPSGYLARKIADERGWDCFKEDGK